MDLPWIAVVAVVVTVGIGLPYWAFRHARFGVLIGVIVVLAGVLTFDVIAISTDFDEAGGITDCWPGCSGWQEFLRWTFWPGLLLLLILALASFGGWLLSRGRRRA